MTERGEKRMRYEILARGNGEIPRVGEWGKFVFVNQN